MKFLEAQKQNPNAPQSENKMREGSRTDQGKNAPSTQVKELAKTLNVDLEKVTGTGRNGEITLRDVHNAKEAGQDKIPS